MNASGPLHTVYRHLLFTLLSEDAKKVLSRKMWARELVGVTLRIDASANVYVNPLRDANYRFMVADWLHILFGRSDVASLARYNSQVTRFSNDGIEFSGAYGPPFIAQLDYVLQAIKEDVLTRRAVMTLWRPFPKLPSKDIPCTVALQFLIRDGRFNVIATMRSSDTWFGLPYDIFNFTQLGNYVRARSAPATQMGELVLSLGSSHLYETEVEAAHKLIEEGGGGETLRSPLLPPVGAPYALNTQLTGLNPALAEPLAHPWDLYHTILRSETKAEALTVLRKISHTIGCPYCQDTISKGGRCEIHS